jgi:transposase
MGSSTRSKPKERRGEVLTVLDDVLTSANVERSTAELLRELVRRLLRENEELKLKQALGSPRKSEGVSTGQLQLMLEQLPPASDERLAAADEALRRAAPVITKDEVVPTKRQPPLRNAALDKLRKLDNPLAVPDERRACPACGGERECMGHDVTNIVDLIPAELIVRVDRREKLVCPTCEGQVERAPVGDKVVAGGKLGATLVATIVNDKYADGLPLHRQARRFELMGWPVSVSTLADQVEWATDLLRPLRDVAVEQVLDAYVMHLDSTGLPVLDRQGPKGKRIGSLLGLVGGDVAAVLYTSTGKKVGQRPGELGPEDILKRRTGYVVADASTVYEASFRRDDLIECGCNMHARRYFVAALDAGDQRATLPVSAFKVIYQLEDQVRGKPPDEVLTLRQEMTWRVYGELERWCREYEAHEPPSSPLGRAIRYYLNNSEALTRFLDDPRIPPDNGVVERLHIRTALTRKNFLFAGSDAGGERAAIAYTILGCCRLADVDPVEYLADVMPRLASGKMRRMDVAGLMPAAWKASRASG